MTVTPELSRGTQVADYRIEAVLGRGGMSIVYLAEDLRLKRRVALKVLAPELAQDERFRERFLAESELAASLDHANVVPVYQAGEDGGSLFIAMRYVEGSDLKALLRDGPLPKERTVALATQVAGALDTAHGHGLVHGDVKPSNVLVDASGHAYLADFGLTRRLGDERSPAGAAQLMATIDYVAPEQIRGEAVDGRADVYSLGCLLYECLTGRQPFKRGNDAAVLYAHLEDVPPPTGTAADEVIATALAKSPDARYQTCTALAEAVRSALGVSVPRRSRLPLAVGGAALAFGVAAFLAVLLTRGGGTPTTPHGQLLRIDPDTNRITGSVDVGTEPTAVASGAGRVWLTSLGDSSIWRIDARTLEPTRIAAQGSPTGVAVRNGTAYVADTVAGGFGGSGVAENQVGGQVLAVDSEGDGGATHSISTHEALAIANGPSGLWVIREPDVARLAVVSGFVGAIDAKVRLPLFGGYLALAVDHAGVWLLGDALDRELLRIDPARRKVAARIHLPFAPAAVAVGSGSVWTTAQLEDEVARIDPATSRIVETIKVGREPLGVAAGADAVWVANTVDRTVSRIDPGTNRVTATISLQGSPTAIAVGEGSVWVAVDAS